MILTFIEIRKGRAAAGSLEALSAAARIAALQGTEAAAVAAGTVESSAADEIFAHGARKLFLLRHPVLARYSGQGYAEALAVLAAEEKPSAIFFSATSRGRDLAPRFAARIGASLASDCTAIGIVEGRLEFSRPVFAGKAVLRLRLKSSPAVATLRPRMFPRLAEAGKSGVVIEKNVALPDGLVRSGTIGIVEEENAGLDVSEAEVVISGGRGMKGPEGFAALKELAALFPKSAVGASRSAVDSGWIGHGHQVGQTGKTVAPDLYLAFGISGAVQHLAGMSGAKCVVAVNKDPDAPIFRIADYGIVGDLFEILPLLMAEIKKRTASA